MTSLYLTIFNARSYIYIGIFVFPFAFLDTTFVQETVDLNGKDTVSGSLS